MKKIKALITGVAGQDGSYMAEILLNKGYEVHGMIRRTSYLNDKWIKNLDIKIHEGDMADSGSLYRIIQEVMPDEVYNFACMAGVTPSFYQPEYTLDIGAIGVIRILEALKILNPKAKFFQAGSSHVFGDTPETPQTEETKFQPISPYGIAKAAGENAVRMYRQQGMFACSAIFYAHASPRYSEGFLLSKIIHSVWRIIDGEQKILEVGNLDVPTDVGFAKEYVEAAYHIMQQKIPDDFLICTRELHTAREFLETAFEIANLKVKDYVKENVNLKRPSEVSVLCGDYSKALKTFGFKPRVKYRELINYMIYR